MSLILHPEAEAEMIDSARYYERQVPGLGKDFLAAVDAAFDDITVHPDRWRILEEDVRRYLMPRFPFGILYQVRTEHVQVVAVAHLSRHPDYWKDRVE